MSVGGLILKGKAKVFASNLHIPDFAGSEGWLTNFKKRHGTTFLCGENGSADDGLCSG